MMMYYIKLLLYYIVIDYFCFFEVTHEIIQPDLTAIRTYFTRWLIRMTSLVQIHKMFAKSYVFYELPICTNLYE